jgi:electron transport complex protein RnfG
MNMDIFKSVVLLALFTLLGASSLLWVHAITEDRIADNERALLLTRLNEILPVDDYDNNLATDINVVSAADLLGSDEPLTIYRARQDGKPVAAIFTTVAPDGYSGSIRLLVGVYMNGKLAGVRVIQHKETPGLGDKIDTSRSNWVLSFDDRSLTNPEFGQWAVKPDGGEFDSFTGATITPRAVVKAVRDTLVYFQQHQEQLFASQTNSGR